MENPDGTRELSTVVHEQVEEMLAQAGLSCRVTDSFTAGNTVMEHLWMGIDPSSIASAPFLPKTLFEDAEGNGSLGRRSRLGNDIEHDTSVFNML